MAVTARPFHAGRFELRRMNPADPLLLLIAVVGGLALILLTTPLGGGTTANG